MSSHLPIEFAGGGDLTRVHESRAAALARAPAWVRQLAKSRQRSGPAKAAPRPQPSVRSSSVAGWVWGLCAGGVSVPCSTANDPHDLPEQFRSDALEGMAKQANSGSGSIRLLWGHGGAELARNSGLDLMLRVVDLFGQPGLALEARLRHSPAAQQALEQLEQGLVGVSLEFARSSSYRSHRPGIGSLRIIDHAELLGIALVPRGSGSKPAYPACTASGRRGAAAGCGPAIKDAVRHRAWQELTEQAKRMA
jgi:hypothetical protein